MRAPLMACDSGSEKLRPASAWSLCNSKLMPFNVTRMVYGLKVLIDV